MMENFCNLPEDVVMEILLFLPAKSLIRFECVCKSWHALISSRQFIAMHLNHNNNTCLLAKHCYYYIDAATRKIQHVFSLISDLDNDFSSIARVNVDVPSYNEEEPEVEFVGHHNGIICFSDSWDHVVLCNPAMREFRVLPRSCIPKPSDPNLECYEILVGFDYDCQTNDYKVVKIRKLFNRFGFDISHRVEVYTLSTDSWREIKDVQLGAEVLHTINFQMHFNGVYYWCAADNDKHNNNTTREVILSFDVVNELFQKIPMPDSCSEVDDNYEKSLMVFKESVTLVHYPCQGCQKSFDFWVMDEFGVKGSWKKLISIGPLPGIQIPLVFWKNSELLMVSTDWQVISYNLKTQEIRNLPIYGSPYYMAAAIYLNTRVSIKPL